MLKILVFLLFTTFQFSFAQDSVSAATGIDGGGGGHFVDNSTTRILGIDAGGGGRVAGGIELLKMERIQGTSKFELKDARKDLEEVFESEMRSDMVIKMMKLKVMADFEKISEITLKDGTVIRAEEIIRGK